MIFPVKRSKQTTEVANPPEPPSCSRCGHKGHTEDECRTNIKLHCDNCGRKGHTKERCRAVVMKTQKPLHEKETIVRPTRNGLIIELKDHQNKEEILKSISDYFNSQADKEKHIKEKARDRRKELKETANNTESEDSVMDTNNDEMQNSRRVDALHHVNGARVFLTADIEDTSVPFMVDTGAAISLLTYKYWKSFPEKIRCNTIINTSEREKTLEGIGGSTQALAICCMPLTVGGKISFEHFWITERCPYNILGVTWLSENQAVIDYSTSSISSTQWIESVSLRRLYEPSTSVCITEIKETSTNPINDAINPDLDSTQVSNVKTLLNKYQALWTNIKLGKCDLVTHTITTKDIPPIADKPRRLNAEKQREVEKQIDALLEAGAIEKSSSAWASPIVLVPKSGGEWRLCVDFRTLNEATKKDAYPLPRIEDLNWLFPQIY